MTHSDNYVRFLKTHPPSQFFYSLSFCFHEIFLQESVLKVLKVMYLLVIALPKKKLGWVGFQKSYVIFRVGHGKCLRLLTRWVGGVKKGQKYAYVIFEWSRKFQSIVLELYISLSTFKPCSGYAPQSLHRFVQLQSSAR